MLPGHPSPLFWDGKGGERRKEREGEGRVEGKRKKERGKEWNGEGRQCEEGKCRLSRERKRKKIKGRVEWERKRGMEREGKERKWEIVRHEEGREGKGKAEGWSMGKGVKEGNKRD